MNVQYHSISLPKNANSLKGALVLTGLMICILLLMPTSAHAAPTQQNLNCFDVLNIQDPCFDLGDAPDSTNSFPGTQMMAYFFNGNPVAAYFPTVHDLPAGQPRGPLHDNPELFHLGAAVSMEGEADIGPDQDGINNIDVGANAANLDRFDDGTQVDRWTFFHCQAATIEVQVTITAAAAAYFAQEETVGYLNGWVDSNRDGDWDDASQCQTVELGQYSDVLEHIIIDRPIDVAALGVGTHTLSITTGLVSWPDTMTQRPTWVRLTLSEKQSNKTLTYGNTAYGDGRGYDTDFGYGETEDYLKPGWNPDGPGGTDDNPFDPPWWPQNVQGASLDLQPEASEGLVPTLFLPLVQ